MFSCSSLKNYKYFEDIPDTTKSTNIAEAIYKEPVIQSDDILYIAIQTVDPLAGTTINSVNNQTINSTTSIVSSNAITGNQAAIYGYLVNKKGIVTIPVLGDIMLAGLNTAQAKDLVTKRAENFYKNPTVIVRYANFRITVLGEVQKPGTFTVPNEKVSLLDALGYAGDLTIYGRRDNILLLRRKDDGTTLAVRLNINNSSVLKSSYFYLQQNDEIYIEPAKTKITGSDASQARNITIVTSALTVLIVLITRIK
ncbi:polysaccharide biosynthesis/export family protein [Mucilaginibacter boryungensis]